MASARIAAFGPHPITVHRPAEEGGDLHLVPRPKATHLTYEAEGTSAELDGAIRVVPALLAALGPVNVSVEGADRLGRIAAAVARALDPASPGGRGMTLAEIAAVAGVALG